MRKKWIWGKIQNLALLPLCGTKLQHLKMKSVFFLRFRQLCIITKVMYFGSVFIVHFVLQGVHEVNMVSVGTKVYMYVNMSCTVYF